MSRQSCSELQQVVIFAFGEPDYLFASRVSGTVIIVTACNDIKNAAHEKHWTAAVVIGDLSHLKVGGSDTYQTGRGSCHCGSRAEVLEALLAETEKRVDDAMKKREAEGAQG